MFLIYMTDLGLCFLKYQQTCIAYNQAMQENRKLNLKVFGLMEFLNHERIGRMEDQIRELAYLKWEAAGYPQGDGVDYWLQAEEELTADTPKTSDKSQQRKIAAKATNKQRK